MAKKPRPRSRHGDGSGWNWSTPRRRTPRPFSLAGAITRIVTFFTMGGKRYRTTERKKGRRAISRVHPHRYRRREYRR